MTVTQKREELHRFIDQLDERFLGRVHTMLRQFILGKTQPKPREKWKAIRTRLNSFSHLPMNWDGYGGIPVSKEVIENCLRLLKQLPEKHLEMLDIEDISPSPYSTVTIDWEDSENNFVSLEVGKDKANYFARLPDGSVSEKESIWSDGKSLHPALPHTLNQIFFSKPI